MQIKHTHWLGLLIFYIFLASCQNTKQENPLPATQYLVKAELIREISQQELNGLLIAAGTLDPALKELAGFALLTRYNVKAYKITYKTKDLEGKEIQASGAMLIPQTTNPLPIVSQQHGTITDDLLAPSNYNIQSEVFSFGTTLASSGYIVSAPDYLGYGASNTIPHPYEHSASLAWASLDMLRAVKEFCQRNNITLNNQFFLAGYSEGGTATMALHKLIESKHAEEFTVTASAPGAGAYHKTKFAEYIFGKNEDLSFLPNYLWVIDTYNKIYASLKRPLSFYLNEPFATQLSQVQKPSDFLSISLSSRNPQIVFTQTFREGVLNKTDTSFLAVLQDNNLYDWKPKAPVRLIHGTVDDFVPIFNSEEAFQAMQAKGATVELIRLEGKDHFTGLIDYVLSVYSFFQNYKP